MHYIDFTPTAFFYICSFAIKILALMGFYKFACVVRAKTIAQKSFEKLLQIRQITVMPIKPSKFQFFFERKICNILSIIKET